MSQVRAVFQAVLRHTSPSTFVVGWTVFDRLYILNGVVYVVSDDEASLPDVQFILSKGVPIEPGQQAEHDRLPTDKDIRIISTEEARQLFGIGASIIDGVTVRPLCSLTPTSINNIFSLALRQRSLSIVCFP